MMVQHGALDALLAARAVAVVGASAKAGTVGREMVRQLLVGGYDGPIHPINPRYPDVLGLACRPSLRDLDEPVDLVLLGVADAALEEQLGLAIDCGARAAVIFAPAHAEPQLGPGAVALPDRLARLANEAGLALCGPNGMGFVNLERRLRALAFPERADLSPGPITWISHSGSAFTALLHNARGLRFNLAVSSGRELVTTAADYLAYAVDQPSTRAIALFLETVRDPEGFRAALDAAARRDIAVVALKVGREPAARELVTAHSGALAGEDGAYEALFAAHGVLRVTTLSELEDTLELVVGGRRAAAGGLAAVCDSGGERAHLVDAAAAAGVPFAGIGAGTVERLAAVLDPGLPAVNPVDVWGSGREPEAVFGEALAALADDPGTAAVLLAVDLVDAQDDALYPRIAEAAHAATAKPLAVLSHVPSGIDPESAARLRAAGVPVLQGTATGLAAVGHLLALRDHRALPPVAAPPAVPGALRDRWRRRLASAAPWTEREALALLADYGVPVTGVEPAADADGAVAAAERLGWPVVLKTNRSDIAHKSDVGGVHLGLSNERGLRAAYADLAVRLGPAVLLAATAPPGVELAIGVVHDAQFGPLLVVAAGGVLTELLGDRRLALPPVDAFRAQRLLDGLAVRALLDGVRGRPPADLAAVADAVARLSLLACDLGDLLEALDVNPLVAGPHGCVAVDALVVPRIRLSAPASTTALPQED